MTKILATVVVLAAATGVTARAEARVLPVITTADRVLVADVSPRLSQAQLVGSPPATQRMRIGLALAHPDPAGEDALLTRLFDRSSPDYHQFLTPARYAQRFGVREATQDAVRDWLAGGGLRVEHVTGAGDYFLASGTVAQVQALLKTTIRRYDIGGESFDANATPPVVPRRLPIFDVLGLDSSRRYRTMADLNGVAASPNTGSQSPEDLRSIYEHPDGIDGDGVSVAILGNGATDSVIADLHTFDDLHGLPQLPVDVVRTPANGDFSDTSGNLEWNIDMQAIHGMAPAITREVLYFSPSLVDSEIVASLGTWVNDPNGPPIMSASLGQCEQVPGANPVLNDPALYAVNGNDNPDALPVSQGVSQSSQPTTTMLLQQAVMEGRTFFAASGDNGSSCNAAYPSANGVANQGVPLTSDPANTPFSTGVGGTVLYSDGNEPAARFQEVAWTHSGGNASPFIRAPDYQAGVPNLNRPCTVDSNGQPTNSGELCRGVPDVAAISGDVVSNGYSIVSDGAEASGAGTSLSSPLWAGMWADLASTAVGTTGYGFANRAIYAIAKDGARYAQAFHDITTGSNGGNPALVGYDYVTGFGVPRLAGLIYQVQQVTPAVARRGASRCRDRSAPVSAFKRRALRASNRRLVLAGTSRDRGCRARGAGRVARVKVAVARVRGKRCAFLRPKRGFSPSRSCTRATYLKARGSSRWRLTVRRRMPRGTYRAYVRAVDASGNVGRRTALRFRVR
ncbi:MAG TPA: S53 family peptidase [Solirubrobacteraceae bacterium]